MGYKGYYSVPYGMQLAHGIRTNFIDTGYHGKYKPEPAGTAAVSVTFWNT